MKPPRSAVRQANDVAGTVLFLVSNEASNVSGSRAGGWSGDGVGEIGKDTSTNRIILRWRCDRRLFQPFGCSVTLWGRIEARGEAAKDACQLSKARLFSSGVTALEESQKVAASKMPQAIAEAVNRLSSEDQLSLRDLARTLVTELNEQATTIGLDVGRLAAQEVHLGNIAATRSVGARIQEAHVSGALRVENIPTGQRGETVTESDYSHAAAATFNTVTEC